MTKNQIIQFNRMRAALITISREYCSSAQLFKQSLTHCGLDYDEALEMAYDNIQNEAAKAVRGVREIKKMDL